MIAGSTFLFLIVTYVGCIEAVDLWFMRRVATRVRDVHADVWSAIGAGSLRAFPFGLFARYRGYQQLNDPTRLLASVLDGRLAI